MRFAAGAIVIVLLAAGFASTPAWAADSTAPDDEIDIFLKPGEAEQEPEPLPDTIPVVASSLNRGMAFSRLKLMVTQANDACSVPFSNLRKALQSGTAPKREMKKKIDAASLGCREAYVLMKGYKMDKSIPDEARPSITSAILTLRDGYARAFGATDEIEEYASSGKKAHLARAEQLMNEGQKLMADAVPHLQAVTAFARSAR
ncbi:hypothetical protein GAY33_01105 [Azospirillum brasilense]|uniref:hypothetical protein n=1 Tax=Azospirillum argentinense TaxID=2970906 RepID=UPI00190B5EB5|nr:hypothetical protein [Azospirillum argentinense]MBK3797852.1 hypothetical protein [Azospirillum argentinense]